MFTGTENEVRLIILNPGHFHAALVQKFMYDQVNPIVYVFAPEGPDVEDYLKRIEGFNVREDNPTSWEIKLYTGRDYLEKMLKEKPGNLLIVAGNNAKKTIYIKRAVEAGVNVLADKPMVITSKEFPLLVEAFKIAEEKGVLLYDIMTERYEITTILQRELSMIPEVFGELQKGTAENPAITKESIHHLFKYVAGNPIRRPAWFFDLNQQGEGLVDVCTHLVDLIQWECFPEQIINYESEIEMLSVKRWSTDLNPDQFKKVTGLEKFPDYLNEYIENELLKYSCNGEMIYKIKDIYAKVSVIWNYQAPEGTGDTHYSIMRGTNCNLVIRQGAEEDYKPILYVEGTKSNLDVLEANLQKALEENITLNYPGVELVKLSDSRWTIKIPEEYKTGHEAHFAQVMEKYLRFLTEGHLPEWEVPNMIAKYFTTTKASETAGVDE